MNEQRFDKKLQDLSQNAADHNPLPFKNEAWGKMALLLDAEDKKRRFFAWWWLLPVLFILAIGGYFFYNSGTDNKEKTLTKSTLNNISSKENITVTSSSGNNKLNSITEISSTDKEPVNGDKSTPSLISESKVSTEKVPKKPVSKINISNDDSYSNNTFTVIPNATTVVDAAKVSGKTSTQKAGTKNKIGGNEINGGKSVFVASKPAKNNTETHLKNNTVDKNNSNLQVSNSDINNSLGDKNVNAINNTDTSAQSEIKEMKVTDKGKETAVVSRKENEPEQLKQPDSVKQNSKADSSTKAIAKEIKKKETFLSKFELSALVSGDISTVKFKNIDKISSAYGFGLSYAISKKLSISTGFAVSRKLYLADSTSYTYVSANPMWKLSTVNANCLVYEVPLNIQYQLKEKGKNSWYAVAGLSSYFMKNEAYNYNLRYYNQTKVYDSTIINQNNHLFGVLNLAVAYRRQFSKRWSYQLMPFVKVPLTGIGMGKVALYSVGLQLSVNLKGK